MVRTIAWYPMAALVLGCAHKPPPTLHSTRLIVRETNDGGFQPLVRAKVAGEEITLLLDTGATRSVLPESFARAHGFGREWRSSDERFVDAFGHTVAMQRLDGVPVQFEGEATAGTVDFVMNPTAVPVAILAPQDLLRPGFAVVFDFPGGELRYESEADALKRLLAEPASRVRQVDFRYCIADGFFSKRRRVITASVNGTAAELLFDTGATNSTLSRNHPAVRALENVPGRLLSVGAVTSTGETVQVDDVTLEFAETRHVIPVSISLRSEYECGRGVLGADVLRDCTIVWGYDSLWASCRARTTGARPG